MEDLDFRDFYIENVLGDIKRCVSNKINLEVACSMELNSGRAARADEAMKRVLDDILLHSTVSNDKQEDLDDNLNYNFLIFQDCDEIKGKKKLKCSLVLYYTALYFRSLDVLRMFFRDGFDFGEEPAELSLCFLDSNLVSLFNDREEYLKIAKRSRDAFESFYRSIGKVTGYERQKYLEKFSSIVKKIEKIPKRALNKDNLDIYDEDTYLKASSKQLFVVIDQETSFKEEKNITRVNRLIKDTDFSYGYGSYSDEVFNMFSDEELLDIDFSLGGYLVRAAREGADVERLKRLVSLNRELISTDATFNPNVLKLFTDEEFANMSKDFLHELYLKIRIYFPKEWTNAESAELRSLWNYHNKEKNSGNRDGVKQKFKALITRG